MSAAGSARAPDRAQSLDEFLAEDFARIGPGPIERCMRLDGARLYLSGATGFFGRNLLALFAFLARRGASFRVSALSRSPATFLAEQPWCRDFDWLDWHRGDVLEAWPGAQAHDYVLHAATETSTKAHADGRRLFEGIVGGTRRALEFAAARGVRRLLLCGSGAQYGAIPQRFAAGIPETSAHACDPTVPSSAYGEGKRAGEMLAALHCADAGMEFVAARCFAFVGPGLPLDAHFAVGNFIAQALDGGPITLRTRGEALRSYLYGADLAVWLLLLLLEPGLAGAINVGSDRAVRVVDLAGQVRERVAPSATVRPGGAEDGNERRFYVPCIARARALGLEAWTDLALAIERTASWHRARRASLTAPAVPS